MLVHFEGVDDRTAGRSAPRHGSTPRRSATTRQLTDGELWVHELVGAAVVDRAGRELGTVAAVEANPAHDLLVLDGGGLVPMVFVVDQRDGDRRDRSARRPASTCSATVRIDVFSIFPECFAGPLDASLLGRARADGPARPAGARPAGVHHRPPPQRRRRALRRWRGHGHGAGAALRRRRGGRPAAAAAAALGGRSALRPGRRRELATVPGFSLLCGRYEGSTSGWPTTSATASSRWATTCSPAARRRRSS